MKLQQPIVGKWYKDVEIDALFEVVDWDPDALHRNTVPGWRGG